MDEDDIPSAEEGFFYDYAIPTEIGSDEVEPSWSGANASAGIPPEISTEVPSQLTGDGAQSTVISIVDYLNSSLGIDVLSILGTILTIAVILVLTLVAARLVDRALTAPIPRVRGNGKVGLDVETEMTFRTITRRLLVAAIYLLGVIMIIYQIPVLNRVAVTLLAGAGVAGLAIGFAAKDSLSNIISGIFLAVFHPFRVGDYIDFESEYCQVEDLTLRHTTIKTWDGRRIFVPNSMMGNQAIVNWSIVDPVITSRVDFGIGYDSDIDRAREIILDVAKRHPLVLKDREISVRVTELGDFAVNLRLSVELPKRDVAFTTGCEIREAVKRRFDAEGIEIPYPYRNLVISNPEALREVAGSQAAGKLKPS
ncbi:MAG: mechanosensitive ion channel family protein [Methanothrix sp.]|jgi:small-conductance mechanosensitive channel|nr:mechanosensitive ion channel family protein [Methanothrix sp.]